MKKLLALLCAALLCACCVVLAACGGSASSSAAASSAAASSEAAPSAASEPPADPADQFVGEWKLTALEMQGMTIMGDFSNIMGMNAEMTFTFDAGGTGKIIFNEQTAEFTWELNDAGEAVVTVTKTPEVEAASSESAAAAEASGEATDAAAEATDAASGLLGDSSEPIVFKFDGTVLSTTSESNGEPATMYLTKDGKLPATTVISMDNATPITDAKDLEGEWNLVGMNLMGMTVYADADVLAQMSNGADLTLTFNEDGTCSMSGTDVTYSAGPEGAVITSEGADVPVAQIGDGIGVDAGAASTAGIEMILYYAR